MTPRDGHHFNRFGGRDKGVGLKYFDEDDGDNHEQDAQDAEGADGMDGEAEHAVMIQVQGGEELPGHNEGQHGGRAEAWGQDDCSCHKNGA